MLFVGFVSVSYESIYFQCFSCVVAAGSGRNVKDRSSDTHVFMITLNGCKFNKTFFGLSLISLTMRKLFNQYSEIRMKTFHQKKKYFSTEISFVVFKADKVK